MASHDVAALAMSSSWFIGMLKDSTLLLFELNGIA